MQIFSQMNGHSSASVYSGGNKWTSESPSLKEHQNPVVRSSKTYLEVLKSIRTKIVRAENDVSHPLFLILVSLLI